MLESLFNKTEVFFCEYYETLKNTFFIEHPQWLLLTKFFTVPLNGWFKKKLLGNFTPLVSDKSPQWEVRDRVRVRLGIGLGLEPGRTFSRVDFFLEPFRTGFFQKTSGFLMHGTEIFCGHLKEGFSKSIVHVIKHANF